MKKILMTVMAGLISLCGAFFCGNTYISKQAELQSAIRLSNDFIFVTEHIEEDGNFIKEYKNIQDYKKVLERNYHFSDIEKAKLIYQSIGISEESISCMPEDKLLGALNFTDCKQTTSYMLSNQMENVTKAEAIQILKESESITYDGYKFLDSHLNLEIDNAVSTLSSNPSNSSDTQYSDDGMIELITRAYHTTRNTPLADRTYYEISVNATWLKLPKMGPSALLVISTNNAVYDNTYNDYGFYEQYWVETVTSTGAFVRRVGMRNEIDANTGIGHNTYYNTTTDQVKFDYSCGSSSIALRFLLTGINLYDTNGNHTYTPSCRASLSARYSLYNTDANVQGSYIQSKDSSPIDSICISVHGISVTLKDNSPKTMSCYSRPLTITY